jgi:hypothetical protein
MKSAKREQQRPMSQYQQVNYAGAQGTQLSVRIRNPGPADVLCGRGGGINAHDGNVAFRQLVQDQKERYNLAANKQEKAEISQDIVDHVTNRSGRFLQRDESQPFSTAGKNTGWWVEIDGIKAIAKTSQALREGAPRIRAKAAKKTPDKPTGKRSKRSPTSAGASVNSRVSDSSPPARESEEPAELPEEDVVHPLIRGYHDGIHRGKQLIQIIEPPAKKARTETPEREPTPYPENAPTPPPQGMTYNQDATTPTLLSTSHPSKDFGKFSLPGQLLSAPTANCSLAAIKQAPKGTDALHPPETLTVMDPASSSFADIVKPEISCARLHSLTFSEYSEDENFQGDESFANPFENEERLLKQQALASIAATTNNEIDSSGPSVSSINKILRSKSSDSVTKNQRDNASPKKGKSNPRCVQTLRSFMSDLSDIPENHQDEDQDFHEGLKKVHDAVFPGFTSPMSGEKIPTHLIPYNVLKGSPLKRHLKN